MGDEDGDGLGSSIQRANVENYRTKTAFDPNEMP